jgi:PAS domain S-box-containing protein
MTEKKERKIPIQIILIVVFVILASVLFYVLNSRITHNRQDHLQLVTKRYEHAYNTNYDQYKEVAHTIHSGIMDRYNIQGVYQQLLTANEEQKNLLRQELLASIQPRYEKLRQQSKVQQLIHFHLRDNESFLRLHEPDTYGDNLTDLRKTVAAVNRTHLPISGFEEGAMYIGYRFVFPITAADQSHLGSMEVSFGPEALALTMMKHHAVRSNFFTKEELLPDELRKKFKKSHHKGYLFDKNVFVMLEKFFPKEMKELRSSEKIFDTIYANAHSGQAMSTYDPNSDTVITTLPILSPITEEMIAFFTVRSQSDYFVSQRHQFRDIFFLSLLLLVTILSLFFLQYSKRRIVEVNSNKLAKQTQQLVAAQRIAKLGHWELNLLTNDIKWSDQVYHIFGLKPGELTATFEAFLAMVHPDDHDFVTTSYYDSVDKHHPYDIQHRIITKDGEEKWVREICFTEYDEDGTPLRSLGIVHDINSQHIAMTLLQREHERFLQGPVITFTWLNNENWTVEQVSENVVDILEYSTKDFLNGTVQYISLIHNDDLQRVTEEVALNSVLGSKSFTHEPYRLITRNGKIVWVLDTTTVVRNNHGDISHYQGYLVDITKTMLMKEEILETKNRLELVIKGAKLGIWDWNIKNGEAIFNDRLVEMLGYRLNEIKSNYTFWKESLHHDDWEAAKHILADHLAGRTQVYMSEYRMKHKSGQWVWILAVGKVFERDREGQSVRAVGIHIDVTAQKEAELQILRAKEVAESANRTKSTFIANISHELRTPLNAILGHSQVFAEDPSLTSKQQCDITTIHQAGEHLLMLLNDILDFSKIEAGKTELRPTFFNLHLFLQGVMDISRGKVGEIDLLYETDKQLPVHIEADELRLRQVLLNLLSNAIKFTTKGYCLMKVQARRVTKKRTLLLFSIEDSGIGIAPELQEEVFEPFEQVGERLQYSKGSGLGLSISRKLLGLMESELQLVSPINDHPEAGESPGSRFSFSIEVPVASQKEITLKEHSIVTGYTGTEFDRKRVLVVDDNSLNRKVLRNILEPLGFLISQAIDGNNVLAACKQFQPDIILMDLRMPGMDGITATELVKQHPDYSQIPVIAISASSVTSELLKQKSLENTFAGYMNKPFATTELLELLATHLSITLTYAKGQPFDSKSSEIVCPPAESLEELLTLVRSGDITGIFQQIEALAAEESGTYREFCTKIEQLAEDFQLSRIKQLIENCKNQQFAIQNRDMVIMNEEFTK